VSTAPTYSLTKLLTEPVSDQNIRLLAQRTKERFTGLTGTTITAANHIVTGQEDVVKNGLLLDYGNDYTVSGQTVTLAAALVTSDVVILKYLFRAS